MRVVILVGAATMALCGCDWMKSPEQPTPDAAREQLKLDRKTCSSKLTYARLKEYVFDQAARIRNSDPRRLDALAASSVVRMEQPVVKSRDQELNVTVCSGTLVLHLPPGIQDAFDGKPVIQADVEYAAQEAIDGSGLVYSMNGAEPIVYRIATLGLPIRPMPEIAATSEPLAREAETASASQSPPLDPVEKAESAEAIPQPTQAPTPSKSAASPSFNCKHAKTRSERMVCSNGALAAADRRMSAAYYGEMAGADAGKKRALRQTRDRFLAKRERCSTEACVSQVYQERIAEIRRIEGQ